jgi:hypothetical protein
MREAFEIERQTSSLRAAMKPRRKVARVIRRQFLVAMVLRQLDNRFGSQPSIKMVVKQNFGQRLENFFGEFHASLFRSSAASNYG